MKWQLFYCVSVAALTLWALVDQQNQVTELQLYLPQLEKDVSRLKEKNNDIRHQLARLSNPKKLLTLLTTDYAYLMFPDEGEVLEILCPEE